ncbi:Tol-Pal system beta propeller repeat protein TolB [Neisseriaceae bacterium TC5R-5]|nr:Tol-Pal system beta propeller repeat protein TolB [Neisseriaceae bacterium TC5R-5]
MPSLPKLFKQLAIFSFCLVTSAHAALTIDIIGGGANRHAIAIPPFGNENQLPESLSNIIQNNLVFSGAFRLTDSSSAQSITSGQLANSGGGKVHIDFQLTDKLLHKQLSTAEFTVLPAQTRSVAHTIADLIYQAITGQQGIFSTRIAYVLQSAGHYQLQIADVDGGRVQTILRSNEPILSPSWSPDGGSLAYVSFESQKPVVWIQNLGTGKRFAVANFKGSNSAPAWSPDSSQLAVVLTTSGNSQIYLISASGGRPRRLISSSGIDTEPSWSPDGNSLYFVSDRAGSPQIYRVATSGGAVQRISWDGNYNVSPKVSPDGKTLSFIRRENGNFRVMLQDLDNGDSRVLVDSGNNERPSFAPNGRLLLYANNGALYAASLDGSHKVKLAVTNGNVQDPTWGPFKQP